MFFGIIYLTFFFLVEPMGAWELLPYYLLQKNVFKINTYSSDTKYYVHTEKKIKIYLLIFYIIIIL